MFYGDLSLESQRSAVRDRAFDCLNSKKILRDFHDGHFISLRRRVSNAGTILDADKAGLRFLGMRWTWILWKELNMSNCFDSA
jgi:hypothetical protein